MQTYKSVFESPWLDILGSVFIHSLWQGFVVAFVLAVVLKMIPFKQSRIRYTASGTALIILLIMPLSGILEGIVDLKSTPKPLTVDAAVPSLSLPNTAPVNGVETLASSPMYIAPRELMEEENTSFWETMRSWLGVGWLMGIVLMAIRVGLGWRQINRLKTRFSIPVPDELQIHFDRLVDQAGIRSQVLFRQTSAFSEALLIGWIKPMVLLPMSVVSEMSTDHIEAIIAHELAHVKRHDYLMAAIQVLIETVLFYHPAIWWVSRQIRIEREHCCDELAVEILQDRPRYARALLALEMHESTFGRYALSAHDGSLLSRIRRLAAASHGKQSGGGYLILLISILLGFSVLMVACENPRFSVDRPFIVDGTYNLPEELSVMADANDIEGTIAYLHERLEAGDEAILDLTKAVYALALDQNELRQNVVYVFAHINTMESDRVLIQIAERDPYWVVRSNALRSIFLRVEENQSLPLFTALMGKQTGVDSKLYEYPVIRPEQLAALVPSLQRIALDKEQMPGVRGGALEVLRHRKDMLGFFEHVVSTTDELSVQFAAANSINSSDRKAEVIIGLYRQSIDPGFKINALLILGGTGSLVAAPLIVNEMIHAQDKELGWLAMNCLHTLYRLIAEQSKLELFGILDSMIEEHLQQLEEAAYEFTLLDDRAIHRGRASHLRTTLIELNRRFQDEHSFEAFEQRADALVTELTDWVNPDRFRDPQEPLVKFSLEGFTTQLYGRSDPSSRSVLRMLEQNEIERYIRSELRADFIARPARKKVSNDYTVFDVVFAKNDKLLKMVVQRLAPYQFGVLELTALEETKIDPEQLEVTEAGETALRMMDGKGSSHWWLIDKGEVVPVHSGNWIGELRLNWFVGGI